MHKPAAERIQKMLANAGLGSRRRIEDWLRQGVIKVNGQVAGLGDRITPDDRVSINGKPVKLEHADTDEFTILAYHKPVGEICTRRDREGRNTVFEQLPRCPRGRWINVGRLDINTSGLILFTNNGELANRLMHPTSDIEREYAVRVLGKVSDDAINHLLKGVTLEDGEAAFTRIEDKGGQGANHWYNVVLSEGRNREVKRLWESQGVTVSRLMRIRYGPCHLPRSVRPGTAWVLDEHQTQALLDAAGLNSPAPSLPAHERTTASSWKGRRPKSGRKPSQGNHRAGGSAARDIHPAASPGTRGKPPAAGKAQAAASRRGKPGAAPAAATKSQAQRPARGKAPVAGKAQTAASRRGKPGAAPAAATKSQAQRPARGKPSAADKAQAAASRRSKPGAAPAAATKSQAQRPARGKPPAADKAQAAASRRGKPGARNKPAAGGRQQGRRLRKGPG